MAEWIIDNEEHQGAYWRNDIDANVSDRYIFDTERNEWVIIDTTLDYEDNWRNKQTPGPLMQDMIQTVNAHLTEGNIVWSEGLLQWIWQSSSNSEDILIDRNSPRIHDDYVWSIRSQRYVRIMGYNLDYEHYFKGDGWRNDISKHAVMPTNYIFDVGWGQWIMFDENISESSFGKQMNGDLNQHLNLKLHQSTHYLKKIQH